MLHMLRRRGRGEQGFTLIELLVVILIIGILAAIAIPQFIGQKSKGQDAQAKSAVRTAQTAMETCYTETQDYSKCGVATLQGIEPTLNQVPGNTLSESPAPTKDSYTLTVTSSNGDTFSIARASSGAITRACTAAVSTGGCQGGSW